MHICILSVGTRGDVQPYIALGKGLQAAGHQVQLATLGVFEPMVRSYGLGFALIEESPLSFIDRVIASGGNFVQRLLETRRILTTMMERLLEDAWHAVQGADLIITSNLLIYPGYSLSQHLGVPSIGTLLVPYLRTRAFPNPAFFSGQRSLGGRGNLLTYDLFNQATWQLYRSSMNKQRQRFGLSPLPMLGIAGQRRLTMLSWSQIILLIAPWLLLATTYACYQILMRRFGAKKAYLGGFLFYWIVWCLLFPLALLGPQALVHLFRSVGSPFGQPWWLGAFCLIGPPLFAYVFIFPKALQKASVKIVLVSAALAIVNGPLEELLWRGAYLTLFPGQLWLALLYPSIGFALWHFAPQSIFPSTWRGGRVALVAQAGFLGLLFGWVANDTGVILWTAISHILIDFSALGWDVVFTKEQHETAQISQHH